jgi:hypothetical protein
VAHPLFLSLVLVVRDSAATLEPLLRTLTAQLGELVSDYELIVVDNASNDDSVARLRALTAQDGLPNLQVYALTKEVEQDLAAWAGMENALGDFVAAYDPRSDDASVLPAMLERAMAGLDVVFARSLLKPPTSLPYRICHGAFDALFRFFNGFDLSQDASSYRLLSRRVINYLLQHPSPSSSYRQLPATAGFARASIDYRPVDMPKPRKRRLLDSIDRGTRMLVSSTRGPMRMVTLLSLFGAIANLVYSVYVIGVLVLKSDVAPGWVTLSLQQSGMFFLISLVLMVLAEYILQMSRLSNEGPPYHVGQEMTSARLTRRERLNVEVLAPAGTPEDTPGQLPANAAARERYAGPVR